MGGAWKDDVNGEMNGGVRGALGTLGVLRVPGVLGAVYVLVY